jgi:hypothetical protein
MKHIIPVLRAALLIAVLAPLAACSGGIFIDPGHLDADAGALAGLIGEGADWGDDDDGGDTSGGGDSDLVAKWYASQSFADAGGVLDLAYEFRFDGKCFSGGYEFGTYTASGGKITTKAITGQTMGTADYSIAGTELTISNAQALSGLLNNTYYKKAE